MKNNLAMWLLLIEDEIHLADSLKRGLEESGFTVDTAYDGIDGEELALLNEYDVLVVDWNLPLRDGKKVIENVRRAGRRFPIIMLTVHCDVEDRVAGLEAGADDYLCKPFSFEELLARLRTLLRRPPHGNEHQLLETGGLILNGQQHSVVYEDHVLHLRPKEYSILELLMMHPGSVLSRQTISECVWGDHFPIRDNTIDVTVANLRNKLSRARPKHMNGDREAFRIATVRGIGYCLLAN